MFTSRARAKQRNKFHPQPCGEEEIRTSTALLPTTFEAAGERSPTQNTPTTSIHDNPTITMSDSQVTLRTRKFIRNPLLGRKQMVVCVPPLRQPARSPTTTTAERRSERTKPPKRWNTLG
jgi:hypothetical protein